MSELHKHIEDWLEKSQNTRDIREFLVTTSNFIEEKFPPSLSAILGIIYAPFPFIRVTESPFTKKIISEFKAPDFNKIKKKQITLTSKGYQLYPLYDSRDSLRFILVTSGVPDDHQKDLHDILVIVQKLFVLLLSHQSISTQISQEVGTNLLSHLTHDINSLITSVREQGTESREISKKISYMEHMNQDLLFYMRELDFSPVKVKPEQLFHTLISEIPIGEDVIFTSSIEDTKHKLIVDVELLEIALKKIIENSIRSASLCGHEIQFKTQTIRSHSQSDNRFWLMISVCDNGPGIPHDFIERVKQPFFTTFKALGHAGFGLPIAEKIITAHRGILNLINLQEGGIRVEILLPLEE